MPIELLLVFLAIACLGTGLSWSRKVSQRKKGETTFREYERQRNKMVKF